MEIPATIAAPKQEQTLPDAVLGFVEPRHATDDQNEGAGDHHNPDQTRPGEPRSAGPDAEGVRQHGGGSVARVPDLEGVCILAQVSKLDRAVAREMPLLRRQQTVA